MPLIQWIMQNLGMGRKKLSHTSTGTVILYGQAENTNYIESYFATAAIKFQIGSKSFDQYGNIWTVTGISAYSSDEPVYTAKSGTIVAQFSDSELFVNQIQSNAYLMDKLNKNFARLESLQESIDKPNEDLPTYQGTRTIKV
jgi:hypothetical protein